MIPGCGEEADERDVGRGALREVQWQGLHPPCHEQIYLRDERRGLDGFLDGLVAGES